MRNSILRGIYFIDPEDKEFKETIKNARKKLETHYNLVHKFIPVPQAMKIPAAKAAVDKDWENWRKFRRGT